MCMQQKVLAGGLQRWLPPSEAVSHPAQNSGAGVSAMAPRHECYGGSRVYP